MATKAYDVEADEVRSQVRERYGKIAAEFNPKLGASCCGPQNNISLDQVQALYETPEAAELPVDITGLSLGCGDPVTLASLKPGQTVLDLGSGGGIDCFLAAKKVGPEGKVIGVDMTATMIEKARANKAKVGAENVEFRLGEIEHLPAANNSVDVILSNCVINLSPDKPQVFQEAFRVLKPGGRLAVTDIVTDGPLPEEIRQNMNAWAACVAGALDVADYVAAIKQAGFVDVTARPVALNSELDQEMIVQLEWNEGQEPQETPSKGLAYSAKVTARKPG
jgi:arsenite methyltransferase